MTSYLLFNPDTDLDENWVCVVSHGGKTFALFAYINAMTPVPCFASVCHQIDGAAITDEELRELAALIKQCAYYGGWVFDGSYPFLVTPVERERVAKRLNEPA
jgi:hypothetical protein